MDAEQVAPPTTVVLTNMTIHKFVWNATRTKIICAKAETLTEIINTAEHYIQVNLDIFHTAVPATEFFFLENSKPLGSMQEYMNFVEPWQVCAGALACVYLNLYIFGCVCIPRRVSPDKAEYSQPISQRQHDIDLSAHRH